MAHFPIASPVETLWQDEEFALYRGRSAADQAPLLVLAAVAEHPAPSTLARLEHEYALRNELDPAWAARPRALARAGGRTLLVLDDPGGEPLAGRLGTGLELGSCLDLGQALCAALAQVHGHGLIHKDLKPAHILVDETRGQVRLLGFGIASRSLSERQAPEPPEAIAGSLPYMAPEQTGRMNRSVDARSDLYALGVVLYEMLTGVLPFAAADPMGWVHSHVARAPLPPAERRPDIPAPVSAMVMKLLAKTPEERYQTAAGVAVDLRRCRDAWRSRGSIEAFPLGSRDVPDRLIIPERLYGREVEVGALLAAFEAVAASGRPALVLVSGYSGIGKSAVVHELHKALVPARGLFAAGKFDQYQRDIPYATLAQAFRALVRQLLAKSEAEADAWRHSLLAALGPNGRLVTDLVPELERLIGPQPAVPELAPRQADNRFLGVLARFLGVFARREHPLALFLDDLQWLDRATLQFLEHLAVRVDTGHLLVIGAYRDNEVDAAHPLRQTLAAVRQAGAAVHHIVLAPLAAEDLGQLLADALHEELGRVAPLARLVHDKTGGNPFFAIQFLTDLQEEGLLCFDAGAGAWTWDLERIRARGYTDNVVDLMLGKLQRLSSSARAVLGSLACLGNGADSALLAVAHGRSARRTEADLGPAVRAGFVLMVNGGYKFSHDRVQEAAYALIPARRRAARHLAIGRRLLARLPPEALAERLFDVTGQLNRGAKLITDPGERERLGRLNAQAGRRAKAAIAYAAARDHLAQAAALLPPGAWDNDYADTFALYLDWAECEYLAGNFEAADPLFEQVLAQARSPLDRARIHRLRSRLCMMAGRFDEALELIVDALGLLGIALPDTDPALLAAADEEMDRLQTQLAGEAAIARLADLPKATDPVGEMLIGLLVEGLMPAYAARPPIFPLLAAKAVSLSLRYGNTVDSCMAYYSHAIVLIAFRWDLSAALHFSELALALADHFADPRPRGGILVGHGGLVIPWRRHIAQGIPYLERGLAALLEVGDYLTAGSCAMLPVWAVLEQGESLEHLFETAERYAALARQTHNPLVQETVLLCQRLVASLKGQTSPPESFDGDGFSAAECLERFGRSGWHAGMAYCRVMQQIAAYLYGRYPEALTLADEARPVLGLMMAMPVAASNYFYRLLTLAALYPQATEEAQRDYAGQLAEGLARLRFWAENCPENFASRHALAAAEVARIEGRELEAERLFEDAIASARDNGFIHIEALASELAGRFHLGRGLGAVGYAYLRHARYGYARWGAAGKVKDLDQRFPNLRELPPGATPGAGFEQFDVLAAVKASQAVAGEIELERLIETLVRIVLEHAGAERALLARPEGEGYRFQAEAVTGRDGITVTLAGEASGPAEWPEAVLRYVLRTREKVLLHDAAAIDLPFDDAYLRERRPRSVLCLPLLKQARLVGVLYLENRLAPQAFTSERVALLEFLAAQAAISLENATLYTDLRQENSERRQAEAALDESRARLAAILGSALDAIITVDGGQRIVLFNAAAERMFGWSAGDVVGGPLDRLIPERFRVIHREHVRQFGESGTTRRMMGGAAEVMGLRSDGTEFPIDAAISRAEAGGQKLFTVMLRDVSERKRVEAERQAREAAEAANRAKSQFLASMSHELRSPLNTILGFTQLIREDPALPESVRDDLALVMKSGEHLHTLIDHVLDLSKLEAGRVSLDETDFDPGLLLEDVRDIFTPAAAGKGLQLVFPSRRSVPRRVRADALKLRQVLINLVDNALKFTREGGVTVRVEAQARSRDACRLAFEVADTGPGIAPGEQAELFAAFVQTESGRRARTGTGLGLAISRGFVQLMGGELKVESEVGKGSTFRFDIPVRIVQEEASAAAPAAVRQVAGLAPGQPSHRMLVVDDQEEARQLLVRLLAPLGFELQEASDGQEAVDGWRRWHPDLIWMDLRMPGLDGCSAARRIRAEAGEGRPVIIAVTASAFAEERAAILAAGCDDILHKPYREADLFALVEKHLGVRFVYQEEAPAPPALDPKSLDALPEALRLPLVEALVSLDTGAVDQAIANLRAWDPPVAAALAAWARDFQYGRILNLIQDPKQPRNG